MADRVIIVGVRRGGSLVPVSELRQMIGRAGRDHGKTGQVKVIVDEKDEGNVVEMFEEGGTTVVSGMSDPDLLASAILPEICSGAVKSLSDAKQWCSRGFCLNPPVEKAIELLDAVEAISCVGGNYYATEVGRCASKFYFHPADVYAWRENFSTIFEQGLMNDEVAPAWALGNVPFSRIVGDLGDKREIASECRSKIPFGLDTLEGSLINVVTWWYLIGGPSPGTLRPACLERRRDFGRISRALHWLDAYYMKWNMSDFFDELDLRVRKGITPELVPLCKCEGIGKGRAEYLFSLGIKTVADMPEALKKIGDEVEDDFRQEIENIAREYCKVSD